MRKRLFFLMLLASGVWAGCASTPPAPSILAPQSISLVRDPEGGADLWLLDLESGAEQLLLSAVVGSDWHAGEELLLVSGVATDHTFVQTLHPVTLASTTLFTHAENTLFNPRWSPDASQFMFESIPFSEQDDHATEDDHAAEDDHADHEEIMVYKAQRSTPAPEPLLPTADASLNATWSPDGRWMLAEDAATARLIILDAQGKQVRTLDTFGSYAWSPDSTRIVVAKRTPAATSAFAELVLVAIPDGTETPLLSDSSFDHFWPTWSPDGSTIAFLRRSLNEPFAQIWTIALADQTLTQLTADPAYENFDLQWSPDSSQLMWTRLQPQAPIRHSIWRTSLTTPKPSLIAENAWQPRWLSR